ncbi:MAG: DUF2147 domain-containing protein [Antarcticimicrobium sp.]|uniref:DUF2147 domain-containing protein n=1 Tax=Antarcticimicrobium sp. TaxID=2824147 RepID=UPI00260C528C|nr:DUF2147 domain-containing protein [Antarcticimicrobium sp.]MDF1715795.1 DUF2147 domain-containing protein [Antarcticimicrobium sp.]
MQQIIKPIILGAIAALGLAGAALAADPLEGTWKTEVDDGSYAHIDISPCGDAFCGVIAQSFNDSGPYVSENQGKTLVIGMVPQGDGHYAGKVWRPSNDKIYIGKMDLKGNSLALRGCVAGGLICSKQTWKRVK